MPDGILLIQVILMCPFGKEIVAFIVYNDKSREVFYADFTYSFHSELFKVYDFHGFYAVLCQDSCRTTDGAEIETAMFFAGVGDVNGTIPFGYHDH